MRRTARALACVAMLAGAFPAVTVAGGPCSGAAAAAQGVNRAGLVVQLSDSEIREFCVRFTEPSLTGLELLQRSGLRVGYEDYGAQGVAICRIDDVGCDHPTQPCFCRCARTEECVIWGYYTIDPRSERWSFAVEGAQARTVRDGDVDGWRWGSHGESGLRPPDAGGLDEVCARGIAIGAGSPVPPARDGRGASVAALAALAAALAALALLAVRLRRRPR